MSFADVWKCGDCVTVVHVRARILSPTVIAHEIPNLVDGKRVPAASGQWLDKLRPSDGASLCRLARSATEDVAVAVTAARTAQPEWAERTRSSAERSFASSPNLRARRDDAAEIVAAETGKPLELALGETDAAVEMGLFVAGEGRRSYGRTTTAACVIALFSPCGSRSGLRP